MPLTKAEKQTILTDLAATIPSSKAVVFANYSGTTVQELTALRDKLAEQGLKFTVTKNTLVRKAVADAGFSIDDSVLDQPAGITIDQNDEVTPAKLVHTFAKEHENLKVLGAIMNGQWVDAAGVAAYATLPSREQLLGQVVGTIAAPLSSFVNVLGGNLRGLVSVLKQYQEKVASSS